MRFFIKPTRSNLRSCTGDKDEGDKSEGDRGEGDSDEAREKEQLWQRFLQSRVWMREVEWMDVEIQQLRLLLHKAEQKRQALVSKLLNY